ncbi:hypothetical protein VCR17J2_350084 [Vibrio coralliirubri]|nr:hypothetical protein VCR17J2_350084 [Vibrio coralliirubri]
MYKSRSLINEAMLCSLTKALSAGKVLVNVCGIRTFKHYALVMTKRGFIMKWLILSVTLLFVAGCQSTGSQEAQVGDDMNRVHTQGCSS